MRSRPCVCREGGIVIKKLFLSAWVLASLAFLSRCAAVFSVDPSTGYGSFATRTGLLVLLGLCLILFIVFKCYLLRHPLPITLPHTGHDFGIFAAVTMGSVGILTILASVFMLAGLVAGGALQMLFLSREQLIAMGLREFSFRWLLGASILGIPAGIWMLMIAKWNIKGEGEFPGGLWLSLFPGLYYVMRALALYVGGGSNPNDEISATNFCLILLLMVVSARFGSYISLDRLKKYGETMAPAAPLALIAAGAALPNLLLLTSDPISLALLIADCLLALYLFMASRRMFINAKRDHQYSIQEVK